MSKLLIQNKDGILYAAIIERWEYVVRDRAWNWQFHAIDHCSAADQGEARFTILSKYAMPSMQGSKYRIVSISPVIGVFGNEKKGVQI